jgi:SWI/SNF-related matrix-associated actin-dependent regulator 1 of chromatin subfamily A
MKIVAVVAAVAILAATLLLLKPTAPPAARQAAADAASAIPLTEPASAGAPAGAKGDGAAVPGQSDAQAQAQREVDALRQAEAEAQAERETEALAEAQARAEAETQAQREAQARADAENGARLDALQTEVEGLRLDLQDSQAALADERDRGDALEDRVAAQEDLAAAAARSPVERQAALGGAVDGMGSALGALSLGNTSGIDATLAQAADALSAARSQAGQFGATREASDAAVGEQLVAAAREALSRGDLYQARFYLGRAALATLDAHTLASQAAGAGNVAPPPPPQAMGTGTSGY